MLRVQTNDADEVHDFRFDQHGVACLHDLPQVGAGIEEIGRLRSRIAEATLGRGPLLGTVERVYHVGARVHLPLLERGRAGNPAVRRIDDDRAVQLAANRQQVSMIEVVGGFGGLGTVFRELVQCTIDGSSLFASDAQRRNTRRPLQRRRIDEIPHALQIRMSVLEARRAILRSGQRRRKDRECGGASEQ
jgi:hypothetical protein